jgi:hypothetical protein
MRELPTIAPHEGLWVLYALRAAFTGRRDPRRRTRSRTRQLINRRDTAEMESLGLGSSRPLALMSAARSSSSASLIIGSMSAAGCTGGSCHGSRLVIAGSPAGRCPSSRQQLQGDLGQGYALTPGQCGDGGLGTTSQVARRVFDQHLQRVVERAGITATALDQLQAPAFVGGLDTCHAEGAWETGLSKAETAAHAPITVERVNLMSESQSMRISRGPVRYASSVRS